MAHAFAFTAEWNTLLPLVDFIKKTRTVFLSVTTQNAVFRGLGQARTADPYIISVVL